ncbi:hypothetical protein [Methylobacter sp.]|uniref:hypothetical protein n=1 Tax=Methylobacter sp. TaxID=2051955 RepID=UPI003FA5D5F7
MKEHQDQDNPVTELICEACTARFRPIFLAFLTNFAGFLPHCWKPVRKRNS